MTKLNKINEADLERYLRVLEIEKKDFDLHRTLLNDSVKKWEKLVSSRYRQASYKYHPDKNLQSGDDSLQKEVNEAKEKIMRESISLLLDSPNSETIYYDETNELRQELGKVSVQKLWLHTLVKILSVERVFSFFSILLTCKYNFKTHNCNPRFFCFKNFFALALVQFGSIIVIGYKTVRIFVSLLKKIGGFF